MSPRIRIVVALAAALVVVAAFYKLALAPKLERASAVQAQIEETRGKLAEARAQTRTLESVKANYSSDYTTLAGLGKAVPADDDTRSLLVQLDNAAKRSGVDFSSVSLEAAAATAPPASGTSTTPAPATQTAAAALPPGASVGTAGLPAMPFTFDFEGSFFRMSEFLARVQRFVTPRGDGLDVKGRLLTIDGFSLVPSDKGFPFVKASVGATGYLADPYESASAGATASGPAGAAASAAPAPTVALPASRSTTGSGR